MIRAKKEAGQNSFHQLSMKSQIAAGKPSVPAAARPPSAGASSSGAGSGAGASPTFAQKAKAAHDAKTAVVEAEGPQHRPAGEDKEAEMDRMRMEAFARGDARKKKAEQEEREKKAAEAAVKEERENAKAAAAEAAVTDKAVKAEAKKHLAEVKKLEREAAKLEKLQASDAAKQEKKEELDAKKKERAAAKEAAATAMVETKRKAAEAGAAADGADVRPAKKAKKVKKSPAKKMAAKKRKVREPPPAPELPPMVVKLQGVLAKIMEMQKEWPFEDAPDDDALPISKGDHKVTAGKLLRSQFATVDKFKKGLMDAVENCKDYNTDPTDPVQVECVKLADKIAMVVAVMCDEVAAELEQESGGGGGRRRRRGC